MYMQNRYVCINISFMFQLFAISLHRFIENDSCISARWVDFHTAYRTEIFFVISPYLCCINIEVMQVCELCACNTVADVFRTLKMWE